MPPRPRDQEARQQRQARVRHGARRAAQKCRAGRAAGAYKRVAFKCARAADMRRQQREARVSNGACAVRVRGRGARGEEASRSKRGREVINRVGGMQREKARARPVSP